jgi:phosphoribosylamine--glycine ligase
VDVLVIGSGGREHALCLALRRDPAVDGIVCAPGNAGTAEVAVNRPVDVADLAALVALAGELAPGLVVVGPEVPLVAGAADALRAAGHRVFGPSAAAAMLEGSKTFAKDVMAAAGVPTAAAVSTADPAVARRELERLAALGDPLVVKDDGLAAGKGVVVTTDLAAAVGHAEACLARPGGRVVLEEYLDGPEVSLFAVVDPRGGIHPLLLSQDHKRLADGDEGPNTGGMGAYAPLPWAPADLVPQVRAAVLEPVVAELARRGTPFEGLLYAGLALTRRGVRVVEFNVRFGDPETQAVLALLATPLTQVLLGEAEPAWLPGAAVTVVLAAPGYPAAAVTGGLVTGLDEAGAVPGVQVLHAGTARTPEGVVATGGRVLAVTAVGEDLGAARMAAYRAMGRVQLGGGQWRTDIGLAAERGALSV